VTWLTLIAGSQLIYYRVIIKVYMSPGFSYVLLFIHIAVMSALYSLGMDSLGYCVSCIVLLKSTPSTMSTESNLQFWDNF